MRELKKALQHLTIITRELKRRRKERGALELDGTEMKMSVTTSQNRVFVEEVTSDQTLVSGPVRSGPVRSGPVGSGPVRSGPVRSGPVGSGPVIIIVIIILFSYLNWVSH